MKAVKDIEKIGKKAESEREGAEKVEAEKAEAKD